MHTQWQTLLMPPHSTALGLVPRLLLQWAEMRSSGHYTASYIVLGHFIIWFKALLQTGFQKRHVQRLEMFSPIEMFLFFGFLFCHDLEHTCISLQAQSTLCTNINHETPPSCILEIYFFVSCRDQQKRNHIDLNRVTIYQNNSAVTAVDNSFINFQTETSPQLFPQCLHCCLFPLE